MTIKEAITQRHMVRKYINKPISSETVDLMKARISENNVRHGLDLQLVIGNADGISGLAKLLLTRSVYNYIVLAGKECPGLDEKLGYCGADLILYAQTLGLNTWWCGGMFNSKGAMKNLDNANVRVNGVIAIGYGQTQGKSHKSKSVDEISHYEGDAPQWFKSGVEALLCAPTAMNKQPFWVEGKDNKVTLSAGSGQFAGIDLGIGKYHFEVGAGKEKFEWN